MTGLHRSEVPSPVDIVGTFVVDLLNCMAPNPRPYAEVIEAWRTSCPRLPALEGATDSGFIARYHQPGRGAYRLGVRGRG